MSGVEPSGGPGRPAPDCPQPVIETDRGLRVTGLNRPAEQFFGREAGEVVGRPLFGGLLAPDDGRPAPTADGGLDSRVFQARLKSDQPAYVVLTSIPRGPGEGPLFVACDITGQRQAQIELANKRAINLMVSSITSQLLETRLDGLGEDVGEILRTLSMFLGVQCCYLCRLGPGEGQAELLGGWWQEPEHQMNQARLGYLLQALPGMLTQLGRMRTLHHGLDPSPGRSEPDDQTVLEYLRLRGASAVIAVPLLLEERLLGFLACERHDAGHDWPTDEVTMLRIVAEALASALARLEAEERLREQTRFMTLLLETLRTGVMVSHADDERVLTINRHGQELIGAPRERIEGARRDQFLQRLDDRQAPGGESSPDLESSEWLLNTLSGRRLNVLRSAARTGGRDADYLVECFSDISALKHLMENQALDIGLAKKLLNLVEGTRLRHLRLNDRLGLFVSSIALSCMTEGGDHFFVSELAPGASHGLGRALISLKDQSGHQVGCMLRSILTDILHQHLLHRHGDGDLEAVTERLNDLLCNHDLLAADDFLTAVICEIDKAGGKLRYLCCGHPRFLLLRDGRATLLPPTPGEAGANLPLGFLGRRSFRADEVDLKAGDRLILYTDGLLEAAGGGAGGGAFGSRDLAELVNGLTGRNPGLRVEELLRAVLAEVSRLGNCLLTPEGVNQSADDVTLLGLEVEDLAWEHQEVWRPSDLYQFQAAMDRYYEERAAEWWRRGFENPLRLKICLEEAAANAFLHGNRQRPGAAITLSHRYGNDFHLQVTDEGPGFDWSACRRLSRVADPRRESGRGLFLLKRKASHLSWNRAGNQVELALARRDREAPRVVCPPELASLF